MSILNDAVDPLGLGEGIRSGVRKEAENCVSQICNLIRGCLMNLVCLCSNADRLEEDMRELMEVKMEREKRVVVAEVQTPQIEGLDLVKEWVKEVNQVDSQRSEFREGLRSSKAYLRFFCLSYTAADLLKRVVQLRTKRDEFKELDRLALPPPVVRVSLSRTTINRADPTLSSVLQLLRDDGVGLVGITGQRLVGKTTLLQAVNNELLQVRAGVNTFDVVFDVVIWVTVPRNPGGSPDIRVIQKQIGDRLGLSLGEDPAKALWHVLSRRRFLLLLDNVWDKLDLENIGIPHLPGENKCKVVFATPRRDVFLAMGATEEVTLNGLNHEQSWELFRENLGENTKKVLGESPQLHYVAKQIVAQCGGLPISLVTVGVAMARMSHISEFIRTLWRLEDSPGELQGMESILSPLKFSFDHLKDDALRDCLLYCSLFPGGSDIDREQLVEYWVGEGFLGNNGNIEVDRARGYDRIQELENSYLLGGGSGNAGKQVRLPEPVHDLALWLTGDQFDEGNRFLALAEKGSDEVRGVENWSYARRVSLMKNRIERLPRMFPRCPRLQTLLINDNPPLVFDTHENCRTSTPSSSSTSPAATTPTSSSQSLPPNKKQIKARTSTPSSSSTSPAATTPTSSSSTTAANMHPEPCSLGTRSLFQYMICLQVLDLSSTSIDHLPSDVGLLVKLQYLNLSYTKIKSLSTGVGNLVKLRQLNLRATKHLSAIPHEAISKLQKLQALNLYDSDYYFCCGDNQSWECLAELENLDELGLNIKTPFPLQIPPVFRRRFWTRTKFLTIESLPESKSEIQPMEVLKCENGQFHELKVLKLSNLPLSTVMVGADGVFPGPFQGLQHLYISGCSEMKDLGWALKLEWLEEIEVCKCQRIEELLTEEGNDGYRCLRNLRKIHAEGLPQLKAVSRNPNWEFPCLEELKIEDCPNVSRPPLKGIAPKLNLPIQNAQV